MAIRRSKGQFPARLPKRFEGGTRFVDFFNVASRGMDLSVHPAQLIRQEGKVSYIENFIKPADRDAIVPRSGISGVAVSSVNSSVWSGMVPLDVVHASFNKGAQHQPVIFGITSDDSVYISTSFAQSNDVFAPTFFAGTSMNTDSPDLVTDFAVYSVASGTAYNVHTRAEAGFPLAWSAEGVEGVSLSASLDVIDSSGWSNSLFSWAKYVESFDERLIFFNVGTSSDTHPQRVVWSVKAATDFNSIGAGFQDLGAIAEGTAMMADKDRLYLFGEHKIYQGTPRGDVFGFDFRSTHEGHGITPPFSKTLAKTERGLVFVGGWNYEVFLLTDGQVVEIGQPIQRLLANTIDSSISNKIWARYDEVNREYRLYFSNSSVIGANDATNAVAVMPIDSIRQERDGSFRGAWYYWTYDQAFQLVSGDDQTYLDSSGSVFIERPNTPVDTLLSGVASLSSHRIILPEIRSRNFDGHEGIDEVWIGYNRDDGSIADLKVQSVNFTAKHWLHRSPVIPSEFTWTVHSTGTGSMPKETNTAFVPLDPVATRSQAALIEIGERWSAVTEINSIRLRFRAWTGRYKGE